ncbi:fatty acyl-CoA synthetase [Gordonia rubripertincta]|uniref:Fatty acyl-CoA synthetase n=1 Tax=Gordonia rubripertincta TaxID=36822 RepID=A0ABT4MVJ6_GORRU|nr:fatty acyl-CoA synthetase [Gordonia rubripertincta]MCZ4551033.1 fatty acyl-CoA synthetase [Gordonia rubripertincta]
MTGRQSSTVDDILRRSARRSPRRTAIVFQDRSWTYSEFDDMVTRAAGVLLARGLSRGDRVAAYGRNSDAYLLSFLACSRAGLIHVPVNYALTGDELAYLLENSGAELVLADPDLVHHVEAVTPPALLTLSGSEDSLLERSTIGPVPEIESVSADTDLAQLLYTSGTTSRPKGAMMSHRALVHEYFSCILALDISKDDKPLHAMPLYHSAGMHVWMMPYLAVGATNHILQSPDIPTVLAVVEERGIGSVFLAPTVWVPLSQHSDFGTRDLTSLHKAMYGSSIMPLPVLQRLQARLPGIAFYNAFGQSEIGPLATVLGPEDHATRPTSCGISALNVELRVVDTEGNDVAPGERGEVIYRSPQLCDGYWNNPQATAEAFRDGWFRSGDLVTIDDEGFVTVVDRIKDVVNTGGVLVASREVEDVLYTHPAVAEVAVIGVPDDKWIEAIAAFVVTKDDVEEIDLIAYARERLAGYKVPKQIHFVDSLPRNASGKLLKRVIRTEYLDTPDSTEVTA